MKKTKKRTQKNLDLRHGLQNIVNIQGIQPELWGLKWNPSTASGADSLGRRKKTQLQKPHRKEEKNAGGGGGGTRRVDQNGPGLSVTHAGQFTSARVCVGYSEISSGLRQRAARRVSVAPARNHVKLQNAFPVAASVANTPPAVHFRTPASTDGFDGRWFLNVSDWWNSSSRPPLEPFSIGRQGRIGESRSSPRWIQDEQMDGGTDRGTTKGNRKAGNPMIKAG